MQRLRVGIVGVGFIGKRHIDTIRHISGVQLAVVADYNLDYAKKAAKVDGNS